MTTSIRHGFNLTDGFDVAKHQRVSLLSVGVPLSALTTARALLTAAGWQELANYKSRVVHMDRTYDWVNIEAFVPAGKKVFEQVNTIATTLNFSPAIPVFNLSIVHFWQELTYGAPAHVYYDNNKNYWVPDQGNLPFGINSNAPEAYTFIGLNDGTLNRIPAIIVHTSPSIPIRENLYSVEDLAIRTAGVAYLSPTEDDQWVYGLVGKDAICLLNKEKDLTGWVIPNADVQFLLSQSMKYQFEVALVGRAWRNKYKAMSADIFKSIIRNPYHYAERMGYPLAETVAHFYK